MDIPNYDFEIEKQLKPENFEGINPIADSFEVTLRNYLINHSDYFNNHTATSTIHDVLHFKIKNPRNISFVGDRVLCDIYGNEMWICEILERPKYLKGRGQKLAMKPLIRVVKNCNKYFSKFNGVWLIPNIPIENKI